MTAGYRELFEKMRDENAKRKRVLKQTRCYLAGVNSVAKWTRMNMRDVPAGVPADYAAKRIMCVSRSSRLPFAAIKRRNDN